MRFAVPWWLALVPAAIAVLPLVLWWIDRAGRRRLERFARPATLDRIAAPRSPGLVLLRRGLLVAAVAALAVALARPQWGGGEQEVRRRGLDVAFVLDLSQSMDAPSGTGGGDSRLGAAKRAAVDLLAMLRGDRSALVAFAGDAQLLCPLTIDSGAIRLFLDAATTDDLPLPGSDLGAGLVRALGAFPGKERKFKVIIVLSDGEDNEGRALAAAKRVGQDGVVIHAVGFGSPEGEPIPVVDGRGQPAGFKKDEQGHVISSRLDEKTLQEIAAATGGLYVAARAGDRGLAAVAGAVQAMEKRELESKVASSLEDQVEWPLLAGFVLLALEALLALLPARRAPALARAGIGAGGNDKAAAFLLALALGMAAPAAAAPFGVLGRGEGQELYEAGKYQAAADSFRQALEKDPGSAILRYNLGTALLQAGQGDEAIAELSRAAATGGPEVKARAQYNIGNGYYAAGKRKEALEAYRQSLKLAPPDRDAKHNYELAKQELEQQPPPTPTPSPDPQASPPPSPSPSPDSSPPPGPGEATPSPGGGEPSPSPSAGEAPPPPSGEMSQEQAEQLLEALAAQEAAERNQEKKKAATGRRRPLKDW